MNTWNTIIDEFLIINQPPNDSADDYASIATTEEMMTGQLSFKETEIIISTIKAISLATELIKLFRSVFNTHEVLTTTLANPQIPKETKIFLCHLIRLLENLDSFHTYTSEEKQKLLVADSTLRGKRAADKKRGLNQVITRNEKHDYDRWTSDVNDKIKTGTPVSTAIGIIYPKYVKWYEDTRQDKSKPVKKPAFSKNIRSRLNDQL